MRDSKTYIQVFLNINIIDGRLNLQSNKNSWKEDSEVDYNFIDVSEYTNFKRTR